MITQQKKYFLIANLLVIVLIGYAGSVFAEECYSNNFEDMDDVSFGSCGPTGTNILEKAQNEGFFTLNSKGIVKEKAYSGAKSLKIDITLNKGKWCYFMGPEIEKIFLDKPIYFSGCIYSGAIPSDVEVRFGYLIYAKRKGEETQACPILYIGKKEDRDWILQKTDISEEIKTWFGYTKSSGWKAEGAYLTNWYISIRSKEEFHQQRVVFYVDDVKLYTDTEMVMERRIHYNKN